MIPLILDNDFNMNSARIYHESQLNEMEEAVAETGSVFRLQDEYNHIGAPSLIDEKKFEIRNLYTRLGFKNPNVLDIAFSILLEAIENGVFDVKIMDSGDEQIVLYTEKKPKDFRNLAIDEDGDISYMYFADTKEKSERKMFFLENGLDIEAITALL